MLRLAKILVIIFLLVPISASPLGLGDIRLQSALNQQLDAEIELLSLGQTRADEISVGLASREAFARAGIERPQFLSGLRFEVVEGADGNVSIRLASDQPIREPFLDFLIEVNWPSGRLLREYTVLLDPPLFIDESPSVIQAPAVTAAATPAATGPRSVGAAPETAAAATVPGRLSASSQMSDESGWSYGPVQRSDTLWAIAQEYRAIDDSVTVEQVMMALLRNNPQAFFNDNINELKAGHVLRIEDPQGVAAMTHAAAAAEARRQYSQWMDSRGLQARSAEPRPIGGDGMETAQAPVGAAVADTGPRLRLSAPDIADAERFAMTDIDATDAGAADAAVIGRLREDLVAALEISESARQENIELRARLAELEEQIQSMQRLLSLQDDTMAAIQADAGAAPAVETPAAAEQPTPAVAAPPLVPEIAGLIDTVAEDPMMLAAAGVALLLLLLLVRTILRKRQDGDAEFAELPETGQVAATSPVIAVAGTAGVGATAAATTTTAVGATFAGISDAATDGSDDDIGVDLMQTDEEEIDVLAEADVYLAYRRFDKAEELLKDAIGNEPGRTDLLLKLFEVHAASGNVDAFVARAQSVQGGDPVMWQSVAAMGRQLAPAHPLFSADASAVADRASTAESAMSAFDDSQIGDLSAADIEGLDLDFSAEVEHGDGEGLGVGSEMAQEMPWADDQEQLPGVDAVAADFSLDDEALEILETGTGDLGADMAAPAIEMPDAAALVDEAAGFPEAAAMTDGVQTAAAEAVAPASGMLDDQVQDDELERQLMAAAGQGSGADIDWLSEIGNDLEFEDIEGDDSASDFNGLISGEDEVGTKLDLARAYIDMGDQDSARNILNEVTEEGNADQQREANDLMRQIG